MKLSDIFMACLVINACRDIDVFSYIVFVCAAICLSIRVIEMRGVEK